jgi:hypothetical protein
VTEVPVLSEIAVAVVPGNPPVGGVTVNVVLTGQLTLTSAGGGVTVTVGVPVHPVLGRVMFVIVVRPPLSSNCAAEVSPVHPEPVNPSTVTVGGTVYPAPPEVTAKRSLSVIPVRVPLYTPTVGLTVLKLTLVIDQFVRTVLTPGVYGVHVVIPEKLNVTVGIVA